MSLSIRYHCWGNVVYLSLNVELMETLISPEKWFLMLEEESFHFEQFLHLKNQLEELNV